MNPNIRARHAFTAAVLVGLMASAHNSAAQPAGSAAELREPVTKGAALQVIDSSGLRTKGRFFESSNGLLTLETREPIGSANGATGMTRTVTRTFAFADLREVRRYDGLGNGMAIGLAVGGGPAVAFGVYIGALCANEGGRNCPTLALIPLFLAAGGVGLGAAIDAAIDGNRVLYSRQVARAEVRLRPLLTRGGPGAALSVRF